MQIVSLGIMMKKYMLIALGFIHLMVLIPFVFAWHDHTNWVQSHVEERFDKFLDLQPNWQTIESSEKMLKYGKTTLIGVTIVWSVNDDMKAAEYAYKEALFAMISDTVEHNETPSHDIEWHAANIKTALDNMIGTTDRLLSNQIYAMWHTF